MARRFDYLNFPTLLGIFDLISDAPHGEFGDKNVLQAVVESAKRVAENDADPLAVATTYILEIIAEGPLNASTRLLHGLRPECYCGCMDQRYGRKPSPSLTHLKGSKMAISDTPRFTSF